MNRCLAAHTPPGANYPPYINASEQPDGTVRVIVRAIKDGHPLDEAACAHIDMPRDVFIKWCCEALAALEKPSRVFP